MNLALTLAGEAAVIIIAVGAVAWIMSRDTDE